MKVKNKSILFIVCIFIVYVTIVIGIGVHTRKMINEITTESKTEKPTTTTIKEIEKTTETTTKTNTTTSTTKEIATTKKPTATTTTKKATKETTTKKNNNNSNLVSLGTFKLTAYCNCSKCCGKWAGGATASGVMPKAGRTIAVDRNVIPFGAKVKINGKTYIAEDTGSAIKGNRIDIFFDSHSEALKFGVQYAEVFRIS